MYASSISHRRPGESILPSARSTLSANAIFLLTKCKTLRPWNHFAEPIIRHPPHVTHHITSHVTSRHTSHYTTSRYRHVTRYVTSHVTPHVVIFHVITRNITSHITTSRQNIRHDIRYVNVIIYYVAYHVTSHNLTRQVQVFSVKNRPNCRSRSLLQRQTHLQV